MAKKRSARKMKRAMPIQNQVSTGPIAELAGSSAISYYVNAAHLLSMMNRKAYHQVTSGGHLKNYGLEIQAFNMTKFSMKVETAPLAYPTYNATRAWHFVRKDRYAEAGFKLSDLGYGSRLRFALDETMSALNQSTSSLMIKPSALGHSIADKGEWDFSDVIITPPVIDDNSTRDIHADDLTDSFKLTLCGDHTRQATEDSIKYGTVGMIQSWTENRRGWSEPADDEVIQPENPLAFARMSESTSLALTTEVGDEQQQFPPYANSDDANAKSPFATLFVQANLEGQYPNPTTNDNMIVAPGGLAKITISNQHSEAEWPFFDIRIYELD